MAKRKGGLRGRSMGDADLLAAALVGYQQQRAETLGKIAEIQRQLGGRGAGPAAPSTNGAEPARGRRQMSAAGRKRIAAAQRKRWAAYRKADKPEAEKKTGAVQKAAAKPMRRMSAAARKRIADAQKNRWAEARAKKAPKVKAAGA
jgi:hypothetical protein